jgi:hypothetical protein
MPGGRGGQNRTSREEETVRRAGRGRPRAGRGPAPPRGRTTHILVVPAIGLVHDLPVGEVERAGLAALQRRRLEVHADGRGSTLFLRAGRGQLDRRARVLVLDVARRPLRGTLLLDSRPRRRDATHPPRVLLLRGHHRPERARSLAACPDGTSSTVDARVRVRASPTAVRHRAAMSRWREERRWRIAPRQARGDWTAIHWYGETLPSSRRVTTRRIRPDSRSERATWHRWRSRAFASARVDFRAARSSRADEAPGRGSRAGTAADCVAPQAYAGARRSRERGQR